MIAEADSAIAASGLSVDLYYFIIKNYEDLARAFYPQQVTAAATSDDDTASDSDY